MIRILKVTLRPVPIRTRMPFRYGIAVMTEVPHLFVLLEAEIDGRTFKGISADHLPPKWFTKNPARDVQEEVQEMLEVIRNAATISETLSASSLFNLWQELYSAQQAWGKLCKLPPLLYNFGTSLIERALLDAYCRSKERSFHELLQSSAFDLKLGSVHPELEPFSPADFLPRRPLETVWCRHTVGLLDPLEDSDIRADELLNDGLPQSLVSNIRTYGLQQFKIKIGADIDESVERLRRMSAILLRETGGSFAATLDGNECFQAVPEFREFWAKLLKSGPEVNELVKRLLFVEQPFHREVAMDPQLAGELGKWKERPQLIIDESDAACGSLRDALDAGYVGVSHKNCKGVFKGIANACLLAKRRKESGSSLLMSGEDLSNIGPVALLQDLAVQAALGNKSIERNGHHYFRGLSFWPEAIQERMLTSHPDLYRRSKNGWPTLAVHRGRISLDSVNAAPFGTWGDPDL